MWPNALSTTPSPAPVFVADDVQIGLIHTHLNPFRGDRRLAEAGWLTEYAAPERHNLLVGDLNSPGPHDPGPADWSALPPHLYSRHRLVNTDGTYGDIDLRAIRELTAAGFVDPPAALGLAPPRTAGYWGADTWDRRSDHILLSPSIAAGLADYQVLDTPVTTKLSDHLPVIVRLDLDALQDQPTAL